MLYETQKIASALMSHGPLYTVTEPLPLLIPCLFISFNRPYVYMYHNANMSQFALTISNDWVLYIRFKVCSGTLDSVGAI